MPSMRTNTTSCGVWQLGRCWLHGSCCHEWYVCGRPLTAPASLWVPVCECCAGVAPQGPAVKLRNLGCCAAELAAAAAVPAWYLGGLGVLCSWPHTHMPDVWLGGGVVWVGVGDTGQGLGGLHSRGGEALKLCTCGRCSVLAAAGVAREEAGWVACIHYTVACTGIIGNAPRGGGQPVHVYQAQPYAACPQAMTCVLRC